MIKLVKTISDAHAKKLDAELTAASALLHKATANNPEDYESLWVKVGLGIFECYLLEHGLAVETDNGR